MSDSATPWTVAHVGPLFVEFSRQDYWSGLPFPSPGDLPNPEIKPGASCIASRFFTVWKVKPQGSPLFAIPKQCQTRQSVVWKCKDWKEERLKNNDLNFHLKKLEKEQELKKKSGRKEILNTIRESNKLRNTQRTLTKLKAGSLKILIKFISSQQEKKMGKTEITKIRREKWEMTRFLNDKKIFRGYWEKL